MKSCRRPQAAPLTQSTRMSPKSGWVQLAAQRSFVAPASLGPVENVMQFSFVLVEQISSDLTLLFLNHFPLW